jgi:hypothetical protein
MKTYTAYVNGTEFLKICNYFTITAGTMSGKTVNGLAADLTLSTEEATMEGSTWFGITNCDQECLSNEKACPWFD